MISHNVSFSHATWQVGGFFCYFLLAISHCTYNYNNKLYFLGLTIA